MDGIVTGKVEKPSGGLTWKTVKNLYSLASDKRELNYNNQTDLANATHLKLTSLEKNNITIFALNDIREQTYGYSLFYPDIRAVEVCFVVDRINTLVINSKEFGYNITDLLADIELGTLE